MYIESIDREGRVQERIIYRNETFHYGLYGTPEHTPCFSGNPWHWHRDFEFGLVVGGAILYKTNYQEFVLSKGDGIFINSGILHALEPRGDPAQVILRTQFIDRSFLAGETGSAFDIQYVVPVQENRGLDAVPVYQSDPEGRAFLQLLQTGLELGLAEEPFYELRLRSLFSTLWEQVYQWSVDAKTAHREYNDQEERRIKQILAFVREHVGEKLTVREMAAAGHISPRECYRLFRRRLGMTPVEYLLSFRLQCARSLLSETDKSVLEIALETGFGTSSYLGKVMKEHHGISPRAYRAGTRESAG